MPPDARKSFRSNLLISAGVCALGVAVIMVAAPYLPALTAQNHTRNKVFPLKTTVDRKMVLRLQGKPAMGFVWRLDRERSSGLDLVEVTRLGWSFRAGRGSQSFTKPGTLRYLVVGKQTGTARLVFEYSRKVEAASPSAHWIYEVEILR